MNNRTRLCLSAVVVLGALFTIGVVPALADAPDSLNYQGILKTPGGSPVPDGNYTGTFKIYDVAAGPNPALWSETKSITTDGGSYMTLLGSVTPLPGSIFSGAARFLGITVSPDVEEMTPRIELVTVPYAFRVETVDGATGGVISGDINLDMSTVTTGNILKSGTAFIHNYGTRNTFVGINAGNLTMTGENNTGTGEGVLYSNTTGVSNTASGFWALLNNTTGSRNTAGGTSALWQNTTGNGNTASGSEALYSNTIGVANTATGEGALYSNISGLDNTASASGALYSNTYGNFNSAGGYRALYKNTTGISNTASGRYALYWNTAGNYNTASGDGALYSNIDGDHNTASGYYSLLTNSTGNYNTASGSYSLGSNSTGNYNTASGFRALNDNTIGFNNTANGFSALYNNTEGLYNTAGGSEALYSNIDGDSNTATGYRALYSNTTGNNNTASGRYALRTNTTGRNNTAIGGFADVSVDTLTNATAIGANAKVNASNKIRLGNAAVTVIEGQVAYTFPSDKNQKENFRSVDGDEVLRKIRAMSLTSWNYKGHDPEQFRHYGPVAQEFFEAFGRDGVGTSGTPTTINSGDMAGVLMIAVQALEKRTAENAELRARIERLEELMQGTRTGESGASE